MNFTFSAPFEKPVILFPFIPLGIRLKYLLDCPELVSSFRVARPFLAPRYGGSPFLSHIFGLPFPLSYLSRPLPYFKDYPLPLYCVGGASKWPQPEDGQH